MAAANIRDDGNSGLRRVKLDVQMFRRRSLNPSQPVSACFRYVMVTSGAQNLTEKAEKFLKSVSILSVLTDEQRASLAHSLEDLKFEDGEYIVSKGDKRLNKEKKKRKIYQPAPIQLSPHPSKCQYEIL